MGSYDLVRLTFYGGAGEIGGNKILLEDQDTRVFLDFGMSFEERKRFFSEPWLSPRDERILLELGILPKIEGLYGFEDSNAEIDGVFLSHSHADHSMYISLLKREIPIYCGEATALILEALNETRRRDFETDISGLKFKKFHTGDKLKVGSLEVEPVHVDHSVPGSYAYIIHTSEGAVVYSGDYRLHGTKPELTRDFVQKAMEAKPIALLSEGTNIVGGEVSTEGEVSQKIGKVVAGTWKIVLTSFSLGDIDRLSSFHAAAKNNGRYLAISMKQAYLLEKLKRDRALKPFQLTEDNNVLIFRKSKKRYFEWEQEVLKHANVKDSADIRRMQEKTILVSSFSDLKELIDIEPESGSNFILSASEPFNEEMEIEYERFINWLDHFGLPMYHVHCSGHMMPNELKHVVSEIRPKKTFPIHTQHPELYAKFVSHVTRVQVPEKGGTYDLSKTA